ANPGFYIPVLVLEDTSGCRISRIGEMIEVRSLDFDFAASINSQCEGALSPIDFFIQMDTIGADYDFEWQFAGGTPASSTAANPQQISYSSPGIYDVILQVTENGECLTSLHKEGFVQIYPQLLPDIHIPARNGCPPFAPDIQVDSSFFAQEAMQWEWDFGNGVKSSSPQPQPIYETPGTYVIQLHVTSSEACEAVYMDTIVVHSLPEIDAGISKEVCIGGLTYLDATVPNDDSNQIHWFPSDGLDCTDCARPLAGPAQPTTYFLQLTTPEGCQVLDSVDIRIRPYIQPTITVEPDTLICLGRSVKLEVTSDVPIFGYTWDRQDSTLSCHNCPSPVTSPKLSSQYIVSVTGEGGCVAIDSVYIQVVEKQRDLFASDPTICAGGSYQLRVPYEQQEWTAAPGLNCQTCQNPIVFPDSTTTYELTTWDENGCRIRDQIVVNVLSSDAIDAGPDGRICEGDRFQAQASFPGEAVWLYEGNVVAGNTATPWLELNEDSIFILQVTNDLCLLRDSLRVQVRPKPQLELADQIICLGDSIRLNALGNADEYQWFPVSGLEEWTTPDPLAYPRETTTYYLLASLDGCRADTMQVKVEVLPRPEINSVRQWPFISGEPLQLIMEADGPGDLTYNWYPPDGLSCTDCPDPIVKIDQPTIYLFEAIAENGCREQVAIQMEERKICTPDALVLPTAFSPNNDGKNDELFVRGFAEVEIFQLYNRWGEMVFQTTDGTAGWDGTHKGEPLNTDVFIYYIEAICPDTGGRLMKTGDVTLLR
ncbi:MAG: PKD domain-containing protein, partial [Bacteroidota bacterium]